MKQQGKYLSVPAGRPAGSLASIPQVNSDFGQSKFDGMDILGLLGSAFGSVGSIANVIGQNRAIKKQIQAQKEENEKNRQYNLMLAQTQNRWNIEQWQRENDYNSPTAQMARYRAAGLNPNLIYGQQNTSASSPTLTAGASSAPQDMSAIGQKRNFGQAMQEMLNVEMQKAQIEAIKAGTENTKANTEKTTEETKGLTIENMYAAAREGRAIESHNMQIELGKSTLRMNDQQMENLKAQLPEIAARIDSARQSIVESQRRVKQMDDDEQHKLAEDIRKNKELDAMIEHYYYQNKVLFEQANVTHQQYKEAVLTESMRMMGLDAQITKTEREAHNALLQGINIDYNNQLIRVDAMDQRHKAEGLEKGRVSTVLWHQGGKLLNGFFDAASKVPVIFMK